MTAQHPGSISTDNPAGPVGGRWLQAFLTTLIPGLGHLVAGRIRLAAIFGLPVIFGATLFLGVAGALGLSDLAGAMVDTGVIAGLIVVQLVLLGWRLLALGSSLTDPRLPRLRSRDALPVALLVALTIAPQAYAGVATQVYVEETDRVFAGGDTTTGAWKPSLEPTATPTALPTTTPSTDPSESTAPAVSPTPPPSPTPTAKRINVLLIGLDTGGRAGYTGYLTDSMIVVSLDPVGRSVSMVSLPRDMVDVPLPNGKRFSGKLNTLVAYARNHPREFAGSNGKGFDVLMGAVGTLLQIEIDHYATVNLPGFVSVVNSLGGIDVNVAHSFCDPTYRQFGFPNGFSIAAGRHHLNGLQALAYARVRKASGESDLTRATRQQEVLSGIRDAVVHGDFLADPIGFMRAMGKTVETNIPRKLVPELAEAARMVGRKTTYRTVIVGKSSYDARGYVILPDVARIRERAKRLFTEPGTLPDEIFRAPTVMKRTGGSGVGSCAPAATARPTAKPTPKPTAKPTARPTPTPAPPTETPTEPPTEAPPTDPPA